MALVAENSDVISAEHLVEKLFTTKMSLNDLVVYFQTMHYTQKSMQSYAGQSRTLQDGTVRKIQENEASHPGDAGMRAIADRLIANFDF